MTRGTKPRHTGAKKTKLYEVADELFQWSENAPHFPDEAADQGSDSEDDSGSQPLARRRLAYGGPAANDGHPRHTIFSDLEDDPQPAVGDEAIVRSKTSSHTTITELQPPSEGNNICWSFAFRIGEILGRVLTVAFVDPPPGGHRAPLLEVKIGDDRVELLTRLDFYGGGDDLFQDDVIADFASLMVAGEYDPIQGADERRVKRELE